MKRRRVTIVNFGILMISMNSSAGNSVTNVLKEAIQDDRGIVVVIESKQWSIVGSKRSKRSVRCGECMLDHQGRSRANGVWTSNGARLNPAAESSLLTARSHQSTQSPASSQTMNTSKLLTLLDQPKQRPSTPRSVSIFLSQKP